VHNPAVNDFFRVTPFEFEIDALRIEPLTQDHAEGYLRALLPDPETFKWFTEVPRSHDKAGVMEYIDRRTREGYHASAILVQGHFVGSSSYFDVRPADFALEIGHTWFTKEFRGTALNPMVKSAMMAHAVENLGAIRVQLKTDARNLASQKAMEKIGLVREGTLRHNIIMPDGAFRDTVYYSMLRSEWPDMKDRLARQAQVKEPIQSALARFLSN
jgi:RimJ/RimL family protein N-acetyltransferase